MFENNQADLIQRKRSKPCDDELDDDLPLSFRAKRNRIPLIIGSGSDSPSLGPSMNSQTKGNTSDKPIILTDSSSSSSSPSPPPRTKKKTTSGPISISPPVSPLADLIKSANEESDIDSQAENEREIFLLEAKLLSAKAKRHFLEARERKREARKMTAMLAASMSTTKEREGALMLVDPNKVTGEELNELYAVNERYDDWMMDLSKKTAELEDMADKRKKLKQFISLIEEKSFVKRNGGNDGDSEMKPVERNDENDGEVDKISVAEDESDDEGGDKSEKMRFTKDDEDDENDEEYYEGDDNELRDLLS
ncbi:hypothetical protein V493_07186 [Pseudogymnoascus sp. VKM F-4281 (FW-2241)]|nr:hypothetical protein V493_07186 [Pseudogymnoascus sp. VKM F-4281 (FW-2241)]